MSNFSSRGHYCFLNNLVGWFWCIKWNGSANFFCWLLLSEYWLLCNFFHFYLGLLGCGKCYWCNCDWWFNVFVLSRGLVTYSLLRYNFLIILGTAAVCLFKTAFTFLTNRIINQVLLNSCVNFIQHKLYRYRVPTWNRRLLSWFSNLGGWKLG